MTALDEFKQKMREADRVCLKETLSKHVCQLTFKKKDGTKRVMKCTLKEDLLPKIDEKNKVDEEKKRREFPTTLPIFDLDKNEWRCFLIDNFIDLIVLED